MHDHRDIFTTCNHGHRGIRLLLEKDVISSTTVWCRKENRKKNGRPKTRQTKRIHTRALKSLLDGIYIRGNNEINLKLDSGLVKEFRMKRITVRKLLQV